MTTNSTQSDTTDSAEEEITAAEADISLEKVAGLPENAEVPSLKQDQVVILKTDAADIPEEKLFTPVPLIARITTGVPNVVELARRQRETIGQTASEGSSLKTLPPEARVDKFTNGGSLKMAFTQNIEFPDGTEDLIKEQNRSNKRRLAEGRPEEPLII